MAQFFCEGSLRERLRNELGENSLRIKTFTPMFSGVVVNEQVMPLGTLLHVASGDMDMLPAFAVIDGLLAGNINVLALVGTDGCASVKMLKLLAEAEPSLAEYIFVFGHSAKSARIIDRLTEVVDGVVVWGGDAAVSSIRRLAKPDTKIIEWGRKSSFAYCTKEGMENYGLDGLAKHMISTNQLLGSSCQGIFVDTGSMGMVHRFCEAFMPLLEKERLTGIEGARIGANPQASLQVYAAELESQFTQPKASRRVYKSIDCSLIASRDSRLEPSIQFGNAWVKPLPRGEILAALRPYKNRIQTVGLLCAKDEWAELASLFSRTGAVRICPGERMSDTYCGAALNGEYPLRRYTKIVCIE